MERSDSERKLSSVAEDERHPLLMPSSGTGPSSRLYTAAEKHTDSEGGAFVDRAPRLNLSWSNLSAWIPGKKANRLCCRRKDTEPKTIISQVTGCVNSGQLLALMGASGAGKTTLLNLLTGRNLGELEWTGEVRVNGEAVRSGERMKRISAYCQQKDLFIGALTVQEHLEFQAQLRLPSDRYTAQEKKERAVKVMHEMGLAEVAHSKIGLPGLIRGISGGERKRTAFASEMLTNPSIFFCDEPTTGLDSFMAEQVVKSLERLAARGMTIICTIHQPPSEVYARFSNVLLLTEGRTAYLGSARGAIDFFRDDCGYLCPPAFNPADFFINTLAILPQEKAACLERTDRIVSAYENSVYFDAVMADLSSSSSVISSKENINQDDGNGEKWGYNAGYGTQFWLNLKRATLYNYRNKRIVKIRIIQKIIMGIFVGLLYFQTKYDQAGIMDLRGAIFFMLIQVSMAACMGILRSLPQDFPVVVREYQNHMYAVTAYYWAKVVSFLPVFTTDGIIFYIIAYWMVGFRNEAVPFLLTVLEGAMIEQCSAAFGTMISASTPSFQVSIMLVGPLLMLVQLSGGLFMNVDTLPVYISWIQWLSWWRYGFEASMVLQFSGMNISCDYDAAMLPSSPGNQSTMASALPPLSSSCVTQGDQVLEGLSFNAIYLGRDMIMTLVLTVVFYIIGNLTLFLRVRRVK